MSDAKNNSGQPAGELNDELGQPYINVPTRGCLMALVVFLLTLMFVLTLSCGGDSLPPSSSSSPTIRQQVHEDTAAHTNTKAADDGISSMLQKTHYSYVTSSTGATFEADLHVMVDDSTITLNDVTYRRAHKFLYLTVPTGFSRDKVYTVSYQLSSDAITLDGQTWSNNPVYRSNQPVQMKTVPPTKRKELIDPYDDPSHHFVTTGETFFSISRKFRVPVSKLRQFNSHIKNDQINVGDRIRVR